MHFGKITYLLGRVISIVGLTMILPLICAIIYHGPDIWVFAICVPLVTLGGCLISVLSRSCKGQKIRHRDSYLFVTMSWVLAALCGALPYLMAGSFPDLASAVFESFSGFTTTGASVLTDIEIMPRGILLWRSLTHWLGGAGIVLLFISLVQRDTRGGEGVSLFKAEFSGGALAERVASRIEDNAQAIFGVYLAMTVLCCISLLCTGMDFFDAINHTFTTVATGGFSTKNLSIAAFNNPAVEWVIAIFLLLSSINLALYYLFFVRHRFRKVLSDKELHCFLLVVVIAVALISFDLTHNYSPDQPLMDNIRHAVFQVSSIISTGGFSIDNYDLWPNLSRYILFLLIFVGGCAGSTACSIKINRWYMALAVSKAELVKAFRPNAMQRIYYNGRAVENTTVRSLTHYFFMYIALALFSSFLLVLLGVNGQEAIVGSLTSLSNIGPAIGSIGPAGNFAAIPAAGKYILSFLMLAGRLEIYTVMVLFIPSLWKK